MGRLRSDTHTTTVESHRRPSLWAGSLRRDHIRLEDLTSDRIQEDQQYMSSRRSGPSGPSSSSRHSFAWPFHGRHTSEAPSTPRSSRLTFRPIGWQPRTFFRPHDDTASIDRSIVPDYVVNFIRGETPETLARKKERRKWGQHDVVITPHRDTFASHPVELGNFFSSSSDLNRDLNTYSSWSRRSNLRRHITGWRGGVIFNSLISFLILVVGIICLILVIAKTRLLSGESAIYAGDCTRAEHINVGIHIVINVCGIAILSGANYVFQVLSSPTRSEVTVAHGNKRWLDIGVPSLRNFAYISKFRTTVAAILLLSAVANQVIYNAVIFTTRNAVNYDVLFITQSFSDHAPFINDAETNEGRLSSLDITNLQDAASQPGTLTNMTSTTCLREFGGLFESSFDTVLLVTDSVSTTSSLIRTGEPGTQLTTFISNNNGEIVSPDGSRVQYCLARPSLSQTCSVNLSGSILGVAVLLNLATVISMAVILARSTFEPLATLGDAIRSFLRHPDPTTANECLLTKADVRKGHFGPSGGTRYFVPTDHFWFQAPSLARWVLTASSWLAIAAPTAVALAFLVRGNLALNPDTMYDVLTRFGVATSHATFPLPGISPPPETAQMALLAATPQLLLAVLYLTANAHLTTYFLSREFSLFALRARPLRVSSNPAGAQVTSLYLTLPRPASWALLTWFAGMGFALSQAVFPGVISVFPSSTSSSLSSSLSPPPPSPTPRPETIIIAPSFSTQALLALLALLTTLLLVILGLGCARTPAASLASGEVQGNPLALRSGSCSAVVSARCYHRDVIAPGRTRTRTRAQAQTDDDSSLWLRPVAWGVVEEGAGMRPGRCGFSANGVGCVDAGRNYV
ncbi:hypothetical protein AAE478_006443 [Parahypoxylon ruwenzoriense]